MSRARDLANGITTFTGTVDLTGTTLSLDNDQISGDKVSGGTIGAGTFSGTVSSNATFPAGHVVQTVHFKSSSGTNHTSSSFEAIAPSKKSITLKTDNPKIIYVCYLGYESDVTVNFNAYWELRYSTSENSGYNNVFNSAVFNPTLVPDSISMGSFTVTAYHVMNSGFDAGDTIWYQVFLTKTSGYSMYFNQQGTTGVPTNYNNHSIGYIQEVTQ